MLARAAARSAPSLARFLLVLLVLLPITGCRSEPDEPEPPPTNPRGPGHSPNDRRDEPQAPTAPSEEQPEPEPFEEPTAAPVAKAEAKPEEEKKRDYGAELVRAVGGAEGCVKPRAPDAPLPTTVSISLEAYVLESGAVSRGYARSSSLTPEELDCVKTRIEHARLGPAVEEAPRRIDATVELTFKLPEPAPGSNTAAKPAENTAAMPAPNALPTPLPGY